uniref:Uncharacterized protein n=2 Tax=Timema TaxID=61471 RepID=A0A7R9FM26_9NEOP|nr:unnamed protein product [Timema bartmani]CAD7456057.1 unnamed protein product [Timema tahoe]
MPNETDISDNQKDINSIKSTANAVLQLETFGNLSHQQTKIYILFVLTAVIISVSTAQLSRQILNEDKGAVTSITPANVTTPARRRPMTQAPLGRKKGALEAIVKPEGKMEHTNSSLQVPVDDVIGIHEG